MRKADGITDLCTVRGKGRGKEENKNRAKEEKKREMRTNIKMKKLQKIS